MADPMSDEELHDLLPDYLNNVLAPDVRKAVDAYLARDPRACTDLHNLRLLLEEMDRIEDRDGQADAEGRARFLAHAQANPLGAAPDRRRWWQQWSTASWWRPAFALAMVAVLGQGAVIGHLLRQNDDEAAASSRSLGPDRSASHARGPVLSVQVAPDAAFVDLLAAIRDVQGKIVFGTGDSPVLQVEVSGMPVQEAMRRLRQSKAVVSVIELPAEQGGR